MNWDRYCREKSVISMLHNGIQVYSLLAVRMNWDISSRKNIAMSKWENEHPDSNSPNLDLVKTQT